jgi:hypothetical protein
MIPPLVGVALARRYMRQARAQNEKTAGLTDMIRGTIETVRDMGLDVAHVGRQLGRGALELIRDPEVGRRIGEAAKEVGTSPSFVMGALTSAIPATAGALYMYGTRPGKILRQQVGKVKGAGGASDGDQWRERHPAVFAGLVGLGTALSTGILTKFLSDLKDVL